MSLLSVAVDIEICDLSRVETMTKATRKGCCASYFTGLVCPRRARCEANADGTDTTTDVELLLVTTHAGIVDYLLRPTNHVSFTVSS